ncbi:hypothetical protein [Longimicrobium sp.]|jgi:hypothetical protein|uniref:hypothetical protein n=1 Tax=Longimicrobium sp. TaxID=2029185 RepID=UPI002F94EB7F
MPIRCLPFVLALLAFAAPSAAQRAARGLVPGDEVRVRAPSAAPGVIRGEVLRYQGDTLALRQAGTGREFAIHVDSIRGMAQNLGFDRRRSTIRGARLGLFLGAAAGGVAGPFVAMEGTDEDFGTNAALVLAGGALAGTGLGALGGAVFARDYWQSYGMPIRRARVTLSTDRVGISIPVR